MKKSLIKNNFKAIYKTRRRFISILIMAFLGVGFYSGLVASSPDMLDSLDRYVDENSMYDINIISTLGLTDDDIQEIKNIEGVEGAYGIQTKDTIVNFEDKESTCKVIEYNEKVNTPALILGHLPENINECLLDEGYISNGNYKNYIGKKIVLQNTDIDSNDNPIFTVKEFEIVGIAESPIYISGERGNTSIGNGSLNFFIYTQDDVINLDYYTEISISVLGSKNVVTNSVEYLNLINPVIQEIENIKQEREEARYNSLVGEANEKLADAQLEFDNQKLEVENELLSAEKQINDANNKLNSAEDKIKEGESNLIAQEAEINSQFQQAEKRINDAEIEIQKKEVLIRRQPKKF